MIQIDPLDIIEVRLSVILYVVTVNVTECHN